MGKTSASNVKVEQSKSSFAALLREDGDEIRRDVFLMLDPKNTASGRLQAGYTTIYPGCTTRGHEHGDREEIYFFRRGSGVMIIGDEECEVAAGDIFYVKPGPFHTTRNPTDYVLEYFWVTNKID